MKSISKLKDEARRYEQHEEWEKAIQAYLQVLRTADEGETEVELPLYNRVGDLCVRLGKPQEAVRHYEQAADRYAEAGLYNNAIALCNKALRYSPDRLELIRKLGQFSASQGFITDARRYFLDYAERQFKAGKVSEALNALEDFANVSDDADVREMLGRQLKAHGRINDAVDELRRAHALRVRDGQTQQADALREEILAIDPSASIDGGTAAPAGGGRPSAGEALPGLVDIEPERPDTEPTEDQAPGAVPGLESGAPPEHDRDADSVRLAGFETTGQPDFADIDLSGSGDVEGLETTSFDFGDVAADTPGLEDLGLDREETSFDGPTGGDPEVFDLPTLDDPSADFDLPTLDEPEPTTDLPTLDESGGMADLPLLDDDAPGSTDRPDTSDGEAFDLPLLGDDDADDVSRAEATPVTPPGIDDEPPRDVPAANQDDFLGGDLPLDLNSLGGSGSFDLTMPGEDAADTAAWTDEPTFDLPELDGDALGLPTWEPESDPSFDLPSFDTGVEDASEAPADQDAASIDESVESAGAATPLEQPPAAAEPTGGELDAAAPVRREPPGPPAADAAEPGLDIPAIELPTWDTPSTAGAEADAAGAIDDGEVAEPAWVESIAEEEQEASPELPTFTYEDDSPDDDVAAVDDVVSFPDQTAADADDDSDPLGLAAHLAGRAGAGIAPPTPAIPEPAEAPEPTQPTDDDWLSYIAEDDAAAEVEPDADEGSALDVSTDDTESGEDVSAPPAAIQDTAAEADRAEEAARDMVAAPPPAAEPPPPAAEPPPPAPGGARSEGYIDLGALVTGDGEEESTRFRVQETAPTGDEDRDFAELLNQFKAKVQEHLPPEDAAAHYDLGLAFKEMGLIDEAIGEFQVALRAGHMRLRVYEELGQCFLQKEQFNIAEKVLSRALTMKFDDELELLGVYYHLGRAYEALGRRDQARDAYERVLGMDINFGDVTDRLARL